MQREYNSWIITGRRLYLPVLSNALEISNGVSVLFAVLLFSFCLVEAVV